MADLRTQRQSDRSTCVSASRPSLKRLYVKLYLRTGIASRHRRAILVGGINASEPH